MIAVIQRVSEAAVHVDGRSIASISRGFLILLGVRIGDTESDADLLVRKITDLRIFPDADHQMNRSIRDIVGEILVVSQFTLLADCRKGRRPGFSEAAPAEQALHLYEYFSDQIRKTGIVTTTGAFGTMMAVSLVNDGPVTILLDSREMVRNTL